MRCVWFVMTRSKSMPGSDFPGPVGTTIFVECSLRADDIRDALDRAEQAFLNDGYRVEHISRCIGYDLDDWDYDDYPANSDFRQRCETLAASDNIEFGPFCYSENDGPVA